MYSKCFEYLHTSHSLGHFCLLPVAHLCPQHPEPSQSPSMHTRIHPHVCAPPVASFLPPTHRLFESSASALRSQANTPLISPGVHTLVPDLFIVSMYKPCVCTHTSKPFHPCVRVPVTSLGSPETQRAAQRSHLLPSPHLGTAILGWRACDPEGNGKATGCCESLSQN